MIAPSIQCHHSSMDECDTRGALDNVSCGSDRRVFDLERVKTLANTRLGIRQFFDRASA
jgi:hypothetical protein